MPWASHEPKAISLSLEVLLAAAPELHKRQLLFSLQLDMRALLLGTLVDHIAKVDVRTPILDVLQLLSG